MRYLVLSMVALIVAIFTAALWLAPEHFTPASHQSGSGKALIGGTFEAVDHNGNPFTQNNLKGHYSLIYFGFTHCPDICPTSLLIMGNALSELGELGEKIQPIFVSVDPERDTPKTVSKYVKAFHPRFLGVTGTPEQIRTVADAFKVYYSKVDMPDSALEYLVDHSGYIFLMDPKGEYITHFPHNVAEQTLAATLRDYIRK